MIEELDRPPLSPDGRVSPTSRRLRRCAAIPQRFSEHCLARVDGDAELAGERVDVGWAINALCCSGDLDRTREAALELKVRRARTAATEPISLAAAASCSNSEQLRRVVPAFRERRSTGPRR